MEKKTDTRAVPVEVVAELKLISEQIEAHRLVLAWILSKLPDNAGHMFLSRQANIFENSAKDRFAVVIDELDAIRELVFSLGGADDAHR